MQLQRQLGIRRYETAWLMLHKLRRAMVAPERPPLTGPVEVDDFYVGGHEEQRPGGRYADSTKAIVVAAVKLRSKRSGRLRLATASDLSADSCGLRAVVAEDEFVEVHGQVLAGDVAVCAV